MIYAHWQMILFKSISSATYVSLRIALKKIAKKTKEKEERRKPTIKTEKKTIEKCLKHYIKLYYIYNENLPLKVHSINIHKTILFVGQVLNNFNAIHFLKYATQHNTTLCLN